MKKILFLVPHFENKGPVVFLLNLSKILIDGNFQVIILSFFCEREDSLLPKFFDLNIKIIQLKRTRWECLVCVRQIRKIVGELKPDIIHSNSNITDILLMFSYIRNVPMVTTMHNYIYDDLKMQYGNVIGNFICFLSKMAIFQLDIVVTCSVTLSDMYNKVWGKHFIAIPNGIDISEWRSSFIARDEMRKKLGIKKDSHVFLITGLLIKRKNPVMVIEAFKKIATDNDYLIVLGDGEMKTECQAQAIGFDNILFMGKVKNVVDFLYASDIFISASCSEGLPYAILEAQCTGIKMVLSDIPQHREAIHENTKVDFFDLNNIVQLERGMVTSKNNTKRIMYDLNKISCEYMGSAYLKIYEKLIVRGLD